MYTASSKDEMLRAGKDAAQDLKKNANAMMDDAKEDIRDTAHKAGKKLRGFINDATGEIGDASEKVAEEIRNKPVQSALIALGIGFALGALLRR